jgi:hypothetical protein
MSKFDFVELEETKEFVRYMVKYEGSPTLKELIHDLVAYEVDECETPNLNFYIANPSDGKEFSRVITYHLDDEEGEYVCDIGNVLFVEYGSKPVKCDTCEIKFGKVCDPISASYYIDLVEDTAAPKADTEQKMEVAPLLGGVWKWEEEIEPFSIPTKEEIIKKFVTKFLAKMDDIAPERREDCGPQTPWESYLLARDDMMRAILEIMWEER